MANLSIIGVVLFVIVVFLIYMYNSLVSLRNKVKEAFSTMDVYLKKRFDLVPELVTVVKGYASHEASTLEDVVKMRSGAGMKEQLDNETKIGDALIRIMAVVEKYPDLKANNNFLDLQEKLTKIEEDIAFSRRYYNGSVREYNNKCEMFPNNLFANLFNFKPMPMFVANDNERQVQSVNV